MNHSRARRFSSFAAALLLVLAALPAAAQSAPETTFWFAGTRLIFDSPVALAGDVAVSIRDSGLARLLARAGATIAFAPQQRYVVITAADHRLITFTIGDARYTAGSATATAPFAPFFDGNDVIVPLYTIARALSIEPVAAGGETVFEPQIGSLDVRPDGRRTIVTLHAATALRYAKTSDTPDKLVLTFSGLGSALTERRRVSGNLDEVDIAVTGSPKNPTATLTLIAAGGAQHAIATPLTPYDVSIVFAPPGVALDLTNATAASAPLTPPAQAAVAATPSASPPAQPTPAPAQPAGIPARVTDVRIENVPDGDADVRLSIEGTPAYTWHRLRDNRWYVDIANATLTQAGIDERPAGTAVQAVRVRQIGTADVPAVRVAITLRNDNRVDLTPGAGTLTIAIASAASIDSDRSGTGEVGSAEVAGAQTPSVPAAVAAPPLAATGALPPGSQPAAAAPWKFAPVQSTSRIIVIDPGHGGADIGTAHNGLVEKRLTFDISLRLRAMLEEQGWTVKLTHDTDIDPVSLQTMAAFEGDGRPNPSDRAYLQTRCDVANNAGAKLFISIHVNYSESPSVRGTTFYYTKAQDVAFAQAIERSVIPAAGTQDDGVVKANYYVTKHTLMPAVLIETAFISNPGDVALLSDQRFLQNMAAGIAAGVKAYAGSPSASPAGDQ